jgi:transposase-like protein
MSILSSPHFHNEEAAYAYVEAKLWPDGPVCPHCGGVERVGRLKGKSTRIGVHKCYQCRKPFTVKVGTVFEASHVPLRIWLQAIYLLCASKKGLSTQQLHRVLGVTLKTAWFMGHRIREAMRVGGLSPLGASGGPVEVDETYIGVEPGAGVKRGYSHKMKIVSMLERETGTVSSVVMDQVNAQTVGALLRERLSPNARLMTDESSLYTVIGREFASHSVLHHSKFTYVDPNDRTIHTETVEGFYSIFKRGMRGVYQWCSKPHLQRYCAEFDFRYNERSNKGVSDTQRADIVLRRAPGRRLTYRAMMEASWALRDEMTQSSQPASKRRHSRWKTKPSRWKNVEKGWKKPSA